MEDQGTAEKIEELNARSIAHVRNAMATVSRVLDASRRLAELPGHEESAGQRVMEAELELAGLQRELAALEAGDTAAALRIAEQFRAERDQT